ncbi:hypothetical protein SUGI_1180490 [Cryptomeria japonica]|nr:hypothetical protein SUGI_1180490 [Cryptomeria japonica]
MSSLLLFLQPQQSLFYTKRNAGGTVNQSNKNSRGTRFSRYYIPYPLLNLVPLLFLFLQSEDGEEFADSFNGMILVIGMLEFLQEDLRTPQMMLDFLLAEDLSIQKQDK